MNCLNTMKKLINPTGEILKGITSFLNLDTVHLYSRNVSPVETGEGFILNIDM